MLALRPVDEGFLQTASQRYAHTWEIARPASAVWAQLTGERPLSWVRGMRARWTSGPNLGVGSTRAVHNLGPLVDVREYAFLWQDDPGETLRMAFFATAMNLPVFSALAEEYRVQPRDADACAFTWTVAFEPTLLGRPGGPLHSLVIGLAFLDTGRHFRAD